MYTSCIDKYVYKIIYIQYNKMSTSQQKILRIKQVANILKTLNNLIKHFCILLLYFIQKHIYMKAKL